MTDANGIVTEYSYSDAGCVTRIVRKDGSEVLSSLDVASSKGSAYPAGRSLADILRRRLGKFSCAPEGVRHALLFGPRSLRRPGEPCRARAKPLPGARPSPTCGTAEAIYWVGGRQYIGSGGGNILPPLEARSGQAARLARKVIDSQSKNNMIQCTYYGT